MTKYIYQRVRDLREDKDLTQQEIANYLNEHLTTYRRWENGESELPIHIALKLCKFYKTDMNYLTSIMIIK
jgi:transcriptional regulator with XRE-family HTH domain